MSPLPRLALHLASLKQQATMLLHRLGIYVGLIGGAVELVSGQYQLGVGQCLIIPLIASYLLTTHQPAGISDITGYV